MRRSRRPAAPGNLDGNRGTTKAAEPQVGIAMKNLNWIALSIALAFVALVWIPYLILSR